MKTKKLVLFVSLFFLISISNAQTYFQPGSLYEVKITDQHYVDSSVATKAFNTILKFGIPFKYPQGGCESRAYAMGLILDSLKIPNFRIWVFAPNKFLLNNYDLLHVKDVNDKNKDIAWGYHTASIIIRKVEQKIDTLVLDPSLNSKSPLNYKNWLALMQGHEKAEYAFISPKFFMFYLTADNNTSRNKIDFFKYEGIGRNFNYGDMKLEKNLALDFVGRFIYHKYIKNNTNPKNFYLLPIISSINNLEGFVVQNEMPKETDVSIRQIYDAFPDFVDDAKNVFNREVKKWYLMINQYSKAAN